MLAALGPLYQSQSMYGDGPSAGYRGQIGRNAAIPHALAGNITFQTGDVLVTGAGCPMWGYNSELEHDRESHKNSCAALTVFEIIGKLLEFCRVQIRYRPVIHSVRCPVH